jgi:outer membrane protein assembly factor BamB
MIINHMFTKEYAMQPQRLIALFALALAMLTAGCESVSRAYDNAFGSGPAVKPSPLSPITPTASMRIVWQSSVGPSEKQVFYPAVSGGVVYATGAAGNVTGFDTENGKTTVQIAAGQPVSGGVGFGAGLLLLGTTKGEVLAFESTGKLLWKAQLPSEVLAPPEAQNGIVIARAGDSRIYALDAATGKQRWHYQRTTPALTVRTNAGALLDRGAVFAGFPGGRLVALQLSNGAIGWDAVVALPRGTTELERVADITSLPAIDVKQVCAAAYQGRVACLDPARGTVLWARDISSSSGIAIDARNLYVTDDKGAVVALEKGAGSSLWKQDKLLNRQVSGPLPIGRYVVVGDIEGYVHLISREDGAFAARLPTDGSPISAAPVAIGAATFLVQTRKGGVFAIAVQ